MYGLHAALAIVNGMKTCSFDDNPNSPSVVNDGFQCPYRRPFASFSPSVSEHFLERKKKHFPELFHEDLFCSSSFLVQNLPHLKKKHSLKITARKRSTCLLLKMMKIFTNDNKKTDFNHLNILQIPNS